MRVDIDILTNLKYNTFKMLMYSALLLLRCECRAEMGCRVVRDRAFVMLAKTRPCAHGNTVWKMKFCQQVILFCWSSTDDHKNTIDIRFLPHIDSQWVQEWWGCWPQWRDPSDHQYHLQRKIRKQNLYLNTFTKHRSAFTHTLRLFFTSKRWEM